MTTAKNIAIAIAILTVMGAAFGVAWSIYTGARPYGQQPTVDHPREAKVRHAVGEECRQVDDVTGAVDTLSGWTITEGTPARTDPETQTVYVPTAASPVARHEYVHACLFATGVVGGHHGWMRSHCTFCHGSPACAGPCLQERGEK